MEFQTWQAGGFPMLLHDHRFHIQVGLGDAEVIMKFLGRCTHQKYALKTLVNVDSHQWTIC
jgi:hypothetical protein